MFARSLSWIDRKIDISIAHKGDAVLLIRRFTALQRQLPWLYAILLASLLGLQIALAKEKAVPPLPTFILSGGISLRALRWVWNRGENIRLHAVQREMRKTFFIAVIVCSGFAGWTCWLFLSLGSEHLLELILFAGLAAVGCTYAMTGFPGGARVPLVILVLPLMTMLILTGEPRNIGIAVCVTIVSGVTLRLLNVHDDAFVRLVRSNFQITAERKRAVKAEKLAIENQSLVQRIANSDALTGLANRRGFFAALDQTRSSDRRRLALILIDLDGFKPVNDTFGHASGDALLIQVSRRLQSLQLSGSLVARLGGDEFAIVFRCMDEAEASLAARDAVRALRKPFCIDGRKLSISACAGVSFQRDDSLVDAMRRADMALYQSKKFGRGHVTSFTEEMQRDVQRRRSIEHALRKPKIDNEFDVAFQPIFNLSNMALRSFEALARWKHSELGWISPEEFIPITEQISVIESMSEGLLRRAANAATSWPDEVRLSFNLSPVQLCAAGSADRILRILSDHRLEARRLQIEVTETALLADFAAARENISKLRACGVSIVLDDFGAGYSSINYLRQIQFEAVKLDGSLIAGAAEGESGLQLLHGVLALCEAMRLPCVAEHIENEQQLELLRRLGCQFGQGFLLARPLSADQAEQLAGLSKSVPRSQAAA